MSPRVVRRRRAMSARVCACLNGMECLVESCGGGQSVRHTHSYYVYLIRNTVLFIAESLLSNTQRIVDGCGMDLKAMIRHVSLEPVFFLFCVNLGLIMISTQDLYLTKACKVNLRLPEFVCDNLQNRDVKLGYYLQHGNQSGIILSIHQKLSNYHLKIWSL